jgi:hypothetical protein
MVIWQGFEPTSTVTSHTLLLEAPLHFLRNKNVQKWKVFERETFFQTFFSPEVFNSFATCFQNVQRAFFSPSQKLQKIKFF